jgi:uncharacterized protein YkwD
MMRGEIVARLTALMAALILTFVSICQADERPDITSEAVVNRANQERLKKGIPALEANKTLDAIARKRLEDMLEKGYFAHTSPSGEGVPDIAGSLHYDYSRIGENLAKGNFKDVDDLVGFWMKSPQHRKNLLSRGYKEIGVAVAREQVGGRPFWHAVQVFGNRTRPDAEP